MPALLMLGAIYVGRQGTDVVFTGSVLNEGEAIARHVMALRDALKRTHCFHRAEEAGIVKRVVRVADQRDIGATGL
jgi:hypothetical protein